MQIDLPYEIGQTLWTVNRQDKIVKSICPECQGKKQLTLILGDNSQVPVDCRVCGSEWGDPKGYIEMTDYCHHEPVLFTCQTFQINADGVIYYSCDGWSREVSNLYASREECAAACEKLSVESKQRQDDHNAMQRLKRRPKSLEKRAYLLREIARQEEELRLLRSQL